MGMAWSMSRRNAAIHIRFSTGQGACSLSAAAIPPSGAGGSAPGNTTANVNANGDYNQWLAHLSATDSSGQLLLPNGMGTVTSTAVANPPDLQQVQITVTIRWSTGIRQPTITMTTMVAPL